MSGRIVRQTLTHPEGRTEIRIGAGLLDQPLEDLERWLSGRTVFKLSTPRLRRLHGGLLEGLGRAAARTVNLQVPDGETAKTLGQSVRLWEEMQRLGGDRSSRLLTFGGGTVGDLGGFVAGCFLRGIEYVQVPTTLLAQVDASIGGKTAVDLEEGKNSVGLFHHPQQVLVDTAVLRTLHREELRSGLVEIVKTAALLDPRLLERVETTLLELLAGEAVALEPVVSEAIAAKAAVVEQDPTEIGWRRILNFGHTLGHAIESSLGYRVLRHGEAVAYGVLFAIRLAEKLWPSRSGPADLGRRLRRLLTRFDLPSLPDLDPETLLTLMSHDKKATEEGLVWVLPRGLGRGEMVSDLETAEVLAELEVFLSDPWAIGRRALPG